MKDLISWALEKWPFGVIVLGALVFLYGGLLFETGPDVIQPTSAQSVDHKITKALQPIQSQLATLSTGQAAVAAAQHSDRVERLDQQLLWYRQQNCKTRNPDAKQLYFAKMMELFQRYHDVTGEDWHVPSCQEIGD